jgi:octaheme c-type cytochrome (tetrathionate reductase family)
MSTFKYIWVIGISVTALIVTVPIVLFVSKDTAASIHDPWASVPDRNPPVDHTDLLQGPFATGSEVTIACLGCHEDAGREMLTNVHFTWQSPPVQLPDRAEPVSVGKANSLNNFCIGIQSNWVGCTRCHAGYGWEDGSYDFSQVENVDCLVCHDQSGLYAKSNAGQPAEGVDLLTVARSVGIPTRENCGSCHFNGGGGNGVKHGDLDESLYFPTENIDVHMGGNDFLCVDCHRGENHQILGRSFTASADDANQVYCTDCHDDQLHSDERINNHTDAVACQTCHVPAGAVREPTKMSWDWSTAGQDLPEDPHEYLKIKGTFIYDSNIMPDYRWFDGGMRNRYILGDLIDPTQITVMNPPSGSIDDPNSLIMPFKIHSARQPYDVLYNYLLQPKTVGETGYWTTFDWDSALELGSEAVNLAYSGEYGFAATEMYIPLSHMVQPAEFALQCVDCHGEGGRLDWEALGYPGDPIIWGGR